MSVITIILAVVGALALILFVIGVVTEESEDKKDNIENHDPSAERKKRLNEIRDTAPSILRNSLFMLLLRIITFFGWIGGVLFMIYFAVVGFPFESSIWGHFDFMVTTAVATVFMFLFNRVVIMVIRRNLYINELETFIDDEMS